MGNAVINNWNIRTFLGNVFHSRYIAYNILFKENTLWIRYCKLYINYGKRCQERCVSIASNTISLNSVKVMISWVIGLVAAVPTLDKW